MSQPLPRLRADLDFMPSPVPDRPGLLIRDPYQYSDATLIIPPALVQCLTFFDGEQDELDLRAHLVRLTGDLQAGGVLDHLKDTLSNAGFLHDDVYLKLKTERHRQFAEAPAREPAHAGAAYPDQRDPLHTTLSRYLVGAGAPANNGLLGIAAPHVSPEGGWQSYGAAYGALGESYRDRVFVILGTSHYGAPDRFGLTRKPFVTPFGQARPELSLVDRLASKAADAVEMEDYCHATEHSIEFQVVFLQHIFGSDIRILPILCGSYARSIYDGGAPEDNENVRRFLGELGELAAETDRLFWVLGVDMAHMGRRYGDQFTALAGQGTMSEVEERDRDRIGRIAAGDPEGFWELVRRNRDDLKWCGSAPFYTFLRAVPQARGRLLRYEQWNIDEQSVVSFGALGFHAA
ncbi:MAG: AmmeMemoRadiSam system protein B [Bryobacteraceae bacterium]|nr:AmmeMemoRadiSam system protein B [Bryobacteraceae bacterium]